MKNLDGCIAGNKGSVDEIAQIHEIITDIKVNVSFTIAGKKIEYKNISKVAVQTKGVKVFSRRKKKANALFDKIIAETNMLENDSNYVEEKKHEKRLNGVLECIELYPGERRFYDAILNDILCANQVEFYEFLQYWNMTELFPNLTPRRRIHT